LAVNQGLDAVGPAATAPLTFYKDPAFFAQGGLKALAEALAAGTTHVLVLDANPAQAAPGALQLAKLLAAAKTVHCGLQYDETAAVAKLHLPVSHFLEAWSDLATLRGVAAIAQPLIEPLHHTPSTLEVISRAVLPGGNDMYRLVRDTWKASESSWQTWLHDGVVPADAFANGARETTELDFGALGPLLAGAKAADVGQLEVDFFVDSLRLDGRYANNAWLQETPDPMTKLTWDNAALVSRKTAEGTLGGAKNGQIVDVAVGGQTVSLPVYVMPGFADGVVGLVLGHGRKDGGKIAAMHGFDVFPAMPADGWFVAGQIKAGSGFVKLANVQPFGNTQSPIWGAPGEINDFGQAPGPKGEGPVPENIGYRPRSIVFEATRDEYAARPNFTSEIHDKTMAGDKIKSHMYPERTYDYFNGVHQWGMSIDLNVCTGCNACMVACQAENNISVVGKEQVLNGREMSWIRLDRYFVGDADDPQAVLQPLNCQHCETAPCEAVCPVKATAHSNEGLNDMAYNRCIGTRYCSNNCPYKVRRFNFFNYNLQLHPLEQMQKNPDVTIRFRGVIEKCTYCVQRINAAKINAKVHGDGRVRDGGVITACQQVCPADAIVFGDIKDPNSLVSKRKQEPRDYSVLRELNTRPRTTYLAKIRNPNPDLV
jgi:molybdopterin-containing oxidoreductase family iron-sulfur binding subunit